MQSSCIYDRTSAGNLGFTFLLVEDTSLLLVSELPERHLHELLGPTLSHDPPDIYTSYPQIHFVGLVVWKCNLNASKTVCICTKSSSHVA